MTRYQLDPMFDRTPDGAIKGIIRFDIYLDGHFVGSRRTHASCHEYLDELMPSILNRATLRRLSTSYPAALFVVKEENARRVATGHPRCNSD
jgi:hypothetical protein